MQQNDRELLQEAQQFVKNLYASKNGNDLVFHNLDHTRDVVRYCEIIAGNYELNEQQHAALLLAGWFHDVGYLNGAFRQHEEESQKIASAFLNERKADPALVESVNKCIMATKMPQSPSDIVEQIICDADLYHLGTDDFIEKNKLVRREINKIYNNKISKKEWRQINIDFLQRHRYFTEFCRERLEPVKQQHLRNLLKKQGKPEKQMAQQKNPPPPEMLMNTLNTLSPNTVDEQKPKKDKEKDKEPKTERGVVAMFRIMSDNHVNLSQMADSKANIMISVNTIVLSIMVSLLLGKLQFYPEYIIPTIILVTVCLSAVVFAILATRPNISGGTFTKDDILNKRVNLLFFGNFFNMQLPDYEWAMKEMMKDREYLFSSMIKDIYFLGLVLARKYKFLRISYNIFMFGLIAAILAFAIAAFFSEQYAE